MDAALVFEGSLRTIIVRMLEIALSAQPLEKKLAEALQTVLAAGALPVHAQGAIFLADEELRILTLAAGYRLAPEQEAECARIAYGDCLCGRAASERRMVCADHLTDRRGRHGHICAPIQAGGELVGVLTVYTDPEYRPGEREELFFSAVSHSLALLILHHRSDQELAARGDLLENILDHVPFRVFWKDRQSVYLGCNRHFAEDVGLADPAAIAGLRDQELRGRQDEAATYLRRDQRVLADNRPLLDYEELRHLADGREIMVMGSLLPLHADDGAVSGVLGIYADVTALRETENRLRTLTLNDQLTGLPNQLLFKDRLDQAILVGQRLQQILGVICLDLDNFKKINNTLGHAVGDEVIHLAGERLRQAVESSDTVGRMGGDVFVLLIRQLRVQEDIAQVLRTLRQALAPPFSIAGREVFVTASLGVALYPHDGEDAATLLQNAETALHQAKAQGRNGYCLYSSEMNASALLRLSLESQLRRALAQEQFEVFYQPQVCARTARIVGAEALVRWNHPELGRIAPGDFIPLAEENGLIVDIGAWVLNEVCRQARGWRERGVPLERVAVNLSPHQFRHHDLITTVCSALLDTGLEPSMLELEITEGSVMHDAEQAAQVMHYFREMGVRIAIDDFGTGYSSLSLLKKFPITLLKIDRSFVSGIGVDRDDDAIITAIIAMSRRLGLKVLAEGIETVEQWEFLRDSGCDELQGFLFGRPVSLAQFEDLLAAAGTPDTAAGFALPGGTEKKT